MQPLIVLNIVGLTPRHLGANTPRLSAFARQGAMRPLTTTLPAVTCTAQATFMTGLPPDQTGVVANGWLFRDLCEIWFGVSPTVWSVAKKFGKPAKPVIHDSPAPICSGGTTWRQVTISVPPPDRFIQQMGENSPTALPSLPIGAIS